MATFRKAVLRVGPYHSPDGTVNVTADRLRHWNRSVKKIQQRGYAIPMHWDHATTDDMDLLEPIKLTTLQENKDRSAKNTVGLLKDFQLAPDGQSATLIVEARTKGAKEKMESNTVFVSPVLFDRWKDGSGEVYDDMIGSVDLVDYPVDYSQGPFEPVESVATQSMSCVIRMSSAPKKIYRLATMADDKYKDDDPFASTDSGSDDGMNSGSDMGGETDLSDIMDTSPGQETMDSTPTPPAATSVSDVVQSLAQLQIMLPEDTTTENFLERLRPALMTAIAAKVAPAPPPLATQLPPEQQQGMQEQPQLADQPYVAAMSAKLRALEAKTIEDGRAKLKAELNALLKSGRMTPKEFQDVTKKLAVKKMSLSADSMNVESGDIGVWIESRKSLPTGACWDSKTRVERLGLNRLDPPEGYSAQNGITKQQEDKAVAALLG